MNLRRVSVLFLKDLRYGSRGFVFIFAVVMPLALSLIIGILFGTLFSEKPKLGIVDAGSSALVVDLQAADFMTVTRFESSSALMQSLETGGVEVGLDLPAGFDRAVREGAQTELALYVWGQSLVTNRAVIAAAVAERIMDLTERAMPIEVDTVLLGDTEAVPWQQRLIPLIVLISVLFGGMIVPATSMIEERQRRTLVAVTTSPATMAEVFLSKGLMGVLLSVVSALAILTLNGGWGHNPVLLFVVLLVSGTFAASIGLLMGARVKDIQTLFAINKSMGIFIYAPAFIALFPETIPGWVARLFPTYYVLQPVLSISQQGAGLPDIAVDLLILIVMTAVLFVGLGFSAQRLQVQAA